MEDEDEIQSQQSDGDSGSQSDLSPPSNGRITVTVASAPPSMSPPHPKLKALAMAVPMQQKQQSGTKNSGGGGSGREDCWSEEATEVLIEAWGERYLELSRGNLKQKHWKEVAEIVNSSDDFSKTPKTDIQCKNRIDTVKKKYKSEKAKIAAGAASSKWIFYKRMNQLIGPAAKGAINSAGGGGGSGTKVPIGIPVGFRSAMNQFRANPIADPSQQKHPQSKRTAVLRNKNQIQKVQTRKRRRAEPESEEDDDNEVSEESMESLPPLPEKRAKKVQQKEVNSGEEVENWGNSVRELTQVILKFGEAYERAESAKLQQMVEMEKQRMKFAKELELQRMQFFMKTQLEISQLKNGRRGGNGNSSNLHSHMNKHNDNSDYSN